MQRGGGQRGGQGGRGMAVGGRGGRAPGSKGWTTEEKLYAVECVGITLPTGGKEWQAALDL
jgi:hypothetical protein